MAKLELESQATAGVIFIFNQENGKISKGGARDNYSLSEPSTHLQKSCTCVFFEISRTDMSDLCTRGDVKTEHLVASTERDTDAHFFSCHAHVTDHQTHMRLVQGHVDCLSLRAHQKSLIRLMFRDTLFESQFTHRPTTR